MLFRKIKKRFSNLPIRYKIVFSVAMVEFVLLFILAVNTEFFVKKVIKSNEKEKFRTVAYVTSSMLGHHLAEGDYKSVKDFVNGIRPVKDLLSVEVYGREGAFIASTVSARKAFNDKKLPDNEPALTSDDEMLTSSDIYYEGKKFGRVDVRFSNRNYIMTIKRGRFIAVGAGGAFFFINIFAVWWILGMIVRPLKKMAALTERIKEGEYDVSIDVDSGDEIGTLVDGFKKMSGGLKKAIKEIEDYHEEKMAQAEKLASVGELATCVAHEIKNPLAGISCAVEILMDDYRDDDPKKEVFLEILEQVHRLDKTVRDLMDFAKPADISPAMTDINGILKKIVKFLEPKTKADNINILLNLSKDIPELHLDAKKIQEVFLNLTLNALHAMPNGGSLNIHTTLCNTMSAHIVEVGLRDTGKGIEPRELGKIFRPFYTTHHKGTGLGLYISKGIIESHGGEITVESEVGKGTVFTIKLPV